MPGAGDIRDNILFKRETPDGLSFLASMDDCNFCLTDLLDCYNEENPNSTYCDTRNPRELDTPTTHRLIRTIAISCDTDMKIRPANTGLKVTEVMEQEGLSPEDIFIPEE